VSIPNESWTDLDSHADQCAVGRNYLVVHDYERGPMNVSGYDPSAPIAMMNLKTVSVALAYEGPVTGKTVILMVHRAILIVMPDLSHNLLSIVQVRMKDILINETPLFLTKCFIDLTHTIPTEDPPDAPYVIPLSLHGVTSTFPTKKPTVDEFETLPHLTLTSEDPMYDLYDVSFAAEEAELTRYLSKIGDRIGALPPSRWLRSVSNIHSLGQACQFR
jgi:hypothetical protein